MPIALIDRTCGPSIEKAVMRRLKNLVQRVARGMGYEIVNARSCPFGRDALLDIRRLCTAWGWKVDVVFDVGANIGQTVERVIQVFPEASVFAFEPTPSTFAALNKNIASLPTVRAFDIALGNTSGTADLYVYDWGTGVLNSLIPDARAAVRYTTPVQRQTCAVTTLDSFCTMHNVERIDVLKIDTEGFELPILQGAAQLLSRGVVNFVYVEFNDVIHAREASGGALGPLCEFLSPYGFHFIASYTDYVDTDGDLFVVSNALLARR